MGRPIEPSPPHLGRPFRRRDPGCVQPRREHPGLRLQGQNAEAMGRRIRPPHPHPRSPTARFCTFAEDHSLTVVALSRAASVSERFRNSAASRGLRPSCTEARRGRCPHRQRRPVRRVENRRREARRGVGCRRHSTLSRRGLRRPAFTRIGHMRTRPPGAIGAWRSGLPGQNLVPVRTGGRTRTEDLFQGEGRS